ncbi:MAG: DNA primase [Planctomycetota bacterium]|nr:MAG: DNA primase [Planctomycetota bacterium]
MAPAYADDRQRVLDAVDIVDLVRDSVQLKPKGREWVGLCPFHDDHNPSLHVVPAKGIFHCFVCSTGGNALDWVMRTHNLSFREALEALAERAGIELTRRPSAGPHPRSSDREHLRRACRFACDFFQQALHDTPAAQRALEARRVARTTVERFALGYAPDRWDALLRAATRQGVPLEALLAVGLLKERERRRYDAFRDRLIFPIFDRMGRVVAFGGRRLRDDDASERAGPKYLNSADSPLFDKSSTLYALSHALPGIRRRDSVVVVEGYMDALACHQAGLDNVVATMGTALTGQHAAQLAQLCSQAVLVFDGDDAGQAAAERAVEAFFSKPIDVRIAVLPPGKDPDDLLREQGADALEAVFDQAPEGLTFRFERLRRALRGAGPAAVAAAVQREVERFCELGLTQASPVLRRLVARQLARAAGVGEGDVLQTIRRCARAPRRSPLAAPSRDQTPPRRSPAAPPDAAAPVDRLRERACLEMLGCLLAQPALWRTLPPAEILQPSELSNDADRTILQAIAQQARRAETHHDAFPAAGDLVASIDDAQARQRAVALLSRTLRETGEDRAAVAHRFDRARLARRRRVLTTPSSRTLDTAPSRANDSTAKDATSQRLVEALERRRRLLRECGSDPLALARTGRGDG